MAKQDKAMETAEGPPMEENKEAEAPVAEQEDKAKDTAETPPTEENKDMAKETAEAPPTEENKDMEQPASGDTAPMAVQPVHVAPMAGQPVPIPLEEDVAAKSVDNQAEPRCTLVEVVDDKPLGNPALAGVPPKPRCKHCRTLLAAGRCVEPECGKEQGGVEA